MSCSPIGWSLIKLGDIAEFKYGKALPATIRDGGDFPVYGSNGVVGQHSAWLSSAPTIIIGRKGSVGEIRFSNKNCSPIDTTYYIESFDFFEPKFCFYLLKTLKLGELNKSTAIPGLNRQDAYDLEIGLPPLAEQTRIAAKLDELLAQVDTLKARVDGIPALLKRFRQSVLAAAVSGRLTEEWRKENLIRSNWIDKTVKASVEAERAALGFKPIKVSESRNANRTEAPSSWVWLKLSETALKITDGAHNTPKTLEQGFPYITAKNLTGGVLDFTDRKFIAEKEHRELYKKCAPALGDLLIVNIGAGTGNSATVTVEFEFSFKNIAIIKRPKIINPQYLKIFFDARKKTIFNEQTQGGAQPFLSLTMLGNIEIVLPPSEEQTEIVRQVEQLFAFADQLETRVKSIQARIDNLSQSVLAKAFRGELVSQDPNDESASVLLERIKAQRAAAPKAKRGRRSATAGLASHLE